MFVHTVLLSTFFLLRLLPPSFGLSGGQTSGAHDAHRGIVVFVALRSRAGNLLGDSRFNLIFVLEVTALFQANS